MELHYILVVLVIVAIIGFQIYIDLNTKKKIESFKSIFPQSTSSYSIVELEVPVSNEYEDDEVCYSSGDEEEIFDEEYYEDFVNVSQIKVSTKNPTLDEICNALNMYLQKNKVSDEIS